MVAERCLRYLTFAFKHTIASCEQRHDVGGVLMEPNSHFARFRRDSNGFRALIFQRQHFQQPGTPSQFSFQFSADVSGDIQRFPLQLNSRNS